MAKRLVITLFLLIFMIPLNTHAQREMPPTQNWADLVKSMMLGEDRSISALDLDKVQFDLSDTLDLKLFYLYVLRQRHLQGLDVHIPFEQFQAEVYNMRALADPAEIITHRPLLPSFQVYEPKHIDEAAQKLQELQNFHNQKLKTLSFLQDFPELVNTPEKKARTIRQLYIYYKLKIKNISKAIPVSVANRALDEFSDKLTDLEQLKSEMGQSPHEQALIGACYQLLQNHLQDPHLSRGAHIQTVILDWIKKIRQLGIFYIQPFRSMIETKDPVLQTNALSAFYQANAEALSLRISKNKLHHDLTAHFRALASEHPPVITDRQKNRLYKERRAGYIDFHPLPRLLAYHLAPHHLKTQVFQQGSVFYRVSRGYRQLGIVGLSVFLNNKNRYYAITTMPKLSTTVTARLLIYLQEMAKQNGMAGLVVAVKRKHWTPEATEAIGSFLDKSALGAMALAMDRRSLLPEYTKPTLLRRITNTKRVSRILGQRFASISPPQKLRQNVNAHEVFDVSKDMQYFMETSEYSELIPTEQKRITLILKLFDQSRLLEPLAKNTLVTFQTAYLIVFEDRIQAFLKSAGGTFEDYVKKFISFAKNHPDSMVRANAIDDILDKIMRKEFGIHRVIDSKRKQDPKIKNYKKSLVFGALENIALTDESHLVRLRAISTIFKLTQQVTPMISILATEDKHPKVKRHAIWMMSLAGNESHLEMLDNIRRNDDESKVRTQAKKAIDHIEARILAQNRSNATGSNLPSGNCERLMDP